jgi:hypothetical protein
MKTSYQILLLLPVALWLSAGCSKSESLYGKPDNTPTALQLSATVSEETVIEMRANGSDIATILPVVFSWTPAVARGEAIEYIFKMDLSTNHYGATAVRDSLGEGVYEHVIQPQQLYDCLNRWEVGANKTVLIDVAVVGKVRAIEFIKPESSAIQLRVRLTK